MLWTVTGVSDNFLIFEPHYWAMLADIAFTDLLILKNKDPLSWVAQKWETSHQAAFVAGSQAGDGGQSWQGITRHNKCAAVQI